MAINSNVCLHLLHFRPDDDWSIQSKRRQVIFQAIVGTDNLSSSFMQRPTEKPLKMYVMKVASFSRQNVYVLLAIIFMQLVLL